VLVEHARNVMGIGDAVHAEYGASGTEVVSLLSCSLDGLDLNLRIRPGTRLRDLHDGAERITERTTCSYGLNPAFRGALEASGLVVSATDDTTEARAVERRDHPFFLATLYQPQLGSSPSRPHPVLVGLVQATLSRD
jgi:CTP synthase (UTP-ammonia lyase)